MVNLITAKHTSAESTVTSNHKHAHSQEEEVRATGASGTTKTE